MKYLNRVKSSSNTEIIAQIKDLEVESASAEQVSPVAIILIKYHNPFIIFSKTRALSPRKVIPFYLSLETHISA